MIIDIFKRLDHIIYYKIVRILQLQTWQFCITIYTERPIMLQKVIS